MHAFIKYENNQFVLFDNNSKFGTLVGIRKPLILDNEKKAIQIGRTVISFTKGNKYVNPFYLKNKCNLTFIYNHFNF